MRITLFMLAVAACGGGGRSGPDAAGADSPPVADAELDAPPADAAIDAPFVPYDPVPWGQPCERDIYGAITCLGLDGTIGWCVEHGFYTYNGNTAIWNETRPPSCELVCTPPSDTCPGGLTPRWDPNSECFCSPTP